MKHSSCNDPDMRFMEEALRLAARGRGRVSPNPMVGAVLVVNGRVVARGYHHRFGAPHAEVDCLRKYRGDLHHATLYVNLEPCSYFGKTPPCADLLAASGVGRVVVAMRDPNPRVAGRGLRILRSAGVKVTTGVLEKKARELNRHFVRHITSRRPYVHVKIAQTLDGMIAGPGRKRLAITGREAQKLVHRWRGEHDAVLVGAGTVIADDPRLTVRTGAGRDPDVIVVDGRLTVPTEARLFRSARRRRVIVCAEAGSILRQAKKVQRLTSMGVMVKSFAGVRSVIPLREILREVYRENVGSVLVEGGSQIFTQFLRQGPVDELSVFVAPFLVDGGIHAVGPGPARGKAGRGFGSDRVEAVMVGRDCLIEAFSDTGRA